MSFDLTILKIDISLLLIFVILYTCLAFYGGAGVVGPIKEYCEKTVFLTYAKTKTQISFEVTAKLISAFVFATWIVQSLYFLYTKFLASTHHDWLCSLVCVGPGLKPGRPFFSQRGSYNA